MNGFIRNTVAGLCLGTSAIAIVGCARYRDAVDTCYPDRFNFEARQTVHQIFDTQAFNGHVLDQTIWNYQFEKDEKGNATDKLTVDGQNRLNYLIRRRPGADPKVYLQTAHDIASGDQVAATRSELDGRRVQAIQRHLNAQSAGRTNSVAWDVAVHDPAEVGLPSPTQGAAYGKSLVGTGSLGAVSPFTVPSGGGAAAGGGGGGGPAASSGQSSAPAQQAGTPPGSGN